jgi:FtsH-binding integral membrane protein
MNIHSDFELGLNDSFSEKMKDMSLYLRLGFIKKVYGILASQLFVTVLFCIFSMTSKSFLAFQLEHSIIFYLALILSIVLPFIIVCFQETMKKVPQNYIILGLFTLAESYLVSFICGMSNPRLVFMASFMTFAMVIALTIYAATTKTDITMQGGAIFIAGCGLFMLTICGLFTNNKFFHILICVVAICLFGVYIIYDTQLILGHKENSIDLDDYILGAFMLYTDVVNLFLQMLQLLELLNDNRE